MSEQPDYLDILEEFAEVGVMSPERREALEMAVKTLRNIRDHFKAWGREEGQ